MANVTSRTRPLLLVILDVHSLDGKGRLKATLTFVCILEVQWKGSHQDHALLILLVTLDVHLL